MPAHTLRSGNSKHPSSNLHTVNSSDRSTEPSDSETEKVSGFPPVSASPYPGDRGGYRSEEHTSELQSRFDLVCRLLLGKRNIHTCKESESWTERTSCTI